MVVLGLFIVYQLYRFSYTHGVGLIVLTVFDGIDLARIPIVPPPSSIAVRHSYGLGGLVLLTGGFKTSLAFTIPSPEF